MAGSDAGTGYPLTFRCAKCRIGWQYRLGRRDGTNYVATGRTRKVTRRSGRRHVGIRQTHRLIEYRCMDCGHVGWSQHQNLERALERREEKQDA